MKHILYILPFLLLACNQPIEENIIPIQDTSKSFSDTIPFVLDSVKGHLVIDSNGIDTVLYVDTLK